jgi:uncharacterized protein with PQ loop repeat
MSLPLSETLGYIGGSMLALQAVPYTISAFKENSEIIQHSEENQMDVGIIITNIIGSTLMLFYGILDDLQPIYVSMSVIMFSNIISITVKIIVYIKKKHTQRLY